MCSTENIKCIVVKAGVDIMEKLHDTKQIIYSMRPTVSTGFRLYWQSDYPNSFFFFLKRECGQSNNYHQNLNLVDAVNLCMSKFVIAIFLFVDYRNKKL